MKKKYCNQLRYEHIKQTGIIWNRCENYLQTIDNIHILIENSVRNIFDQTATF